MSKVDRLAVTRFKWLWAPHVAVITVVQHHAPTANPWGSLEEYLCLVGPSGQHLLGHSVPSSRAAFMTSSVEQFARDTFDQAVRDYNGS